MKKTILILLCGWFAIMATRAQCAAQNEAIQAGEELVYDLKFNWKFIWVAAGQAKMDMQAITYQGKPCFRSNLISVSNRQVDFFFKMRDTLTCITSSRLEPVYFRKGAEEGDRYTVDEVWFSYKNGKCIADQRLFLVALTHYSKCLFLSVYRSIPNAQLSSSALTSNP